MTVIGEADGEAPYDDGTIYHGVVIMEESNAGYTLIDMDSPTLEYLQVCIILLYIIILPLIWKPLDPVQWLDYCTNVIGFSNMSLTLFVIYVCLFKHYSPVYTYYTGLG
jgi:hypothetical protein